MYKKIIFLLIFLLFPLKTLAYNIVIEDDADLLTNNEEEELYDIMSESIEYGNIIFKTISYNSSSAESYARNYYHSLYGTESGTMFLIDMDNRYLYIFSDGKNYSYITSSKANIIADNVYRYAKKGEYFKCASKTFKQINTVLSGGKISEPMKYISNSIISLILASFIGFIYVIKSSRIKNTIKNFDAQEEFKVNSVNVKKTGIHRVYSPPSSSSGGSSGGGGGGGSSGGGGGHSF